MRRGHWISGLILALILSAPLTAPQAQGKGQGKGKAEKGQTGKSRGEGKTRGETKSRVQEKPRGQDKARSVANKGERPGRSSAARSVDEFGGEVARGDVARSLVNAKRGHFVAHGALLRATRSGLSDDAFVIVPETKRVRILNRSGALLVDMDDERDLGVWRVVTEPDRDKHGAPSFCRAGSGHPVWGRQWCVEKGFGLGHDGEFRWARGIDFDNVIFQRPITMTELLTRELLLGMLGDDAFNRLAVHAVSLGLVQPLTGRWLGEPTGPGVLLVSSGGWPVAELVDVNRDSRAELLVVATRP